ncbi:hypothetical protein [Labilibaculum euxinus]|uniref:Uncharacterized protein n=1 Tax=Labilibaculum euxinus TaxID=2686357 RepID=A0A7M4D2E3_9BACT|nr:hypothetical protein [Labilibaculum euxinus]MUP36822.1 hypothetical protein [Labilibaculum euxinus]MVB06027.1 hypothetical protein [Labilibaculum euxinus]
MKYINSLKYQSLTDEDVAIMSLGNIAGRSKIARDKFVIAKKNLAVNILPKLNVMHKIVIEDARIVSVDPADKFEIPIINDNDAIIYVKSFWRDSPEYNRVESLRNQFMEGTVFVFNEEIADNLLCRKLNTPTRLVVHNLLTYKSSVDEIKMLFSIMSTTT